ncbi:MAG: prepilin peptidase [Candidatus Curtissbacteria bacterium]|nr:prepilin peptidase [Candidatus Curtissbacteria bacterium]
MPYLIFFILGSAVGSFLNVVIDRVPAGLTILGRSYCDRCRRALSVFDLVPILSFFILGGRCRKCKKPISRQYPTIEGLTGLIFVAAFWKAASGGNFNLIYLIFILFIFSIMIIVSAVDFKFSLIPTSLVFAASFVALFFDYFFKTSPEFAGFVIAAFLLAAFFGLIVFLTKGKGMGEGDIILAFLIGMVLGIRDGTLAVFLAFLIGATMAIFLILAGRKRFGQTIPFAPFLVLGFFISLFFATPIINYYFRLF